MQAEARARGLAVLTMTLLVALGWAGTASAAPLGLSAGDTVTSIEFESFQSSGDGGTFDVPTNLFESDGDVTSVVVAPATPITQSDVRFMFSLDFVSETLNINLSTGQAFGNALLASPGVALGGPDVRVTQGGVNILFGNFTSQVVAFGNIDIGADVSDLVAVGRITITGGASNLVDALGGAGVGQANLLLTASLFNFSPSIGGLIADNMLFNSNWAVDLSGTLIPLNSEGFVPEPSTALLLGFGLVGMVGVARRTRRG